jgi:hypothetical protein
VVGKPGRAVRPGPPSFSARVQIFGSGDCPDEANDSDQTKRMTETVIGPGPENPVAVELAATWAQSDYVGQASRR